mmetsp:Transcript_12358/g.43525  ORF Transcript_12358/g.43525 Transcript_12358/m.43525 type:complete len:239 (-) Transcript_12358:2-718(-)
MLQAWPPMSPHRAVASRPRFSQWFSPPSPTVPPTTRHRRRHRKSSPRTVSSLLPLLPVAGASCHRQLHPLQQAAKLHPSPPKLPSMQGRVASRQLQTRSDSGSRCTTKCPVRFESSGGSYLRTVAILDAFAPQHVARIDWKELVKKEGDKALSSDFAMVVVLAARGWVVYPWEESAQNMLKRGGGVPEDEEGRKEFEKKWPAYNLQAAFQHNHKASERLDIRDISSNPSSHRGRTATS